MSPRRRSSRSTVVLSVGFLLATPACERRPASRMSDAPPLVGSTKITAAELARSPASEATRDEAPRGLVEVAVSGEPTSYAVGPSTGASPRIIYFHGMCSESKSTLGAFEATAREHGGVLALTGDKPCGGGLQSFTVDPELQQRRIDAALAASAGEGKATRPPEVVIGYSQGATLAEKLVAARGYPYAVLIGSPREPSPANLQKARAVVLISGELDMAKPKMMAARDACAEAGIPAHYIEMPGAKHGELPDADAVLGEAIRWMEANGRAAPSSGGGP